MEEFAEDEAIIAAGPSPQNSSDDSDESDDGRSDLSMSHYDSRIERLVEALDLTAIASAASRVETLQAENESLKRRLAGTCVVCFERAPDVVFMPCFHAVSCSNCGLREEVDTCPVCRVPIEQKHRIYVS